jgi:pyridoxine kinase
LSTVIAAHELSGIGRCSLTAALSVLPALGHVCWPLPTAALNKQTAFPGYSYLDFTAHLPEYLEGWRGMNLAPDLIYTGFLGSEAQPALMEALIAAYPEARCVIDPVMGDGGALYPCFSENFAKAMKKLAKSAHILLPNATEFNILAGRAPDSALPESDEGLLAAAKGIGSEKLEAIVVTSAGAAPDMQNLLIDTRNDAVTKIPGRNTLVHFSGAGDLFASALCGLILNGLELAEAVRLSADFVADSVELAPQGHDPRFGAPYEKILASFALNSMKGADDHARQG